MVCYSPNAKENGPHFLRCHFLYIVQRILLVICSHLRYTLRSCRRLRTLKCPTLLPEKNYVDTFAVN